MRSNIEIYSELKSILNQVINNYHPERVILFGSATKGNLSNVNDFDLLVIKNTTTNRLRRRGEALKNVILQTAIN